MHCIITILLMFFSGVSHATDFNVALAYGQSNDFWKTVQSIQDKTGDLAQINDAIKDKYGKPDLLYSYFDAAYTKDNTWFDSEALNKILIGTRAEAVAGGEISNPIFPEIQAYSSAVGISTFGFTTSSNLSEHSFWEVKGLAGFGADKQVYAVGGELIDSIPVRSGLLFVAGAEATYADQNPIGDDFWITSTAQLRPIYFHSTIDSAKSRHEDHSFPVLRWKMQNEWLKETDTFLSQNTRVGLISVLGQQPQPYLILPVTWDYQQKLKVFPGFGSVSGLGGIARVLSKHSMPNFSIYAGLFAGAIGGGIDLQIGDAIFQFSSFGVENFLTVSRENTRVWSLSAGLAL